MTTTIPAGWKLVPVEPTDEMETAAEDDYEQRGETFPDWKAKYRAMLAVAPTHLASAQPERDWELRCDHCDGSGHVLVERQVAERKSDVQEFKEECECCEGRGFTIAFEDIPGIAEYVKSCRAPSAPGDAQDERRMEVLYVAGAICRHLDMALDQSKVMAAARDIAQHFAAPAAGDALDAKRYRWLRDESQDLDLFGSTSPYVIEGQTTEPLEGEALDAAIDAALAAQVPQQGEA